MAADKIRVAREEPTGTTRDEALTKDMETLFVNSKRFMDEYAKISLEHSQNAQQAFQQATLNLQGQLAALNATTVQALQNSVNVTNQAHQNAVETANMVGKQAIKHADVAAEAQWNPVQQGAADTLTARGVNLDDAALKSIGVAAAQGAQAALTPVIAVLQQVIDRLTAQIRPANA